MAGFDRVAASIVKATCALAAEIYNGSSFRYTADGYEEMEGKDA